MSLRRVFVDSITGGKAGVSGERAHHLVRVARLRLGERVEVTDHARLYLARVTGLNTESVEFTVEREIEPAEDSPRISLLPAIVKPARFEWAVEKLTELGVTRIIPVAAYRSDKKLVLAAPKRSGRRQRIAEQAAQQCRRMTVPEITDPMSLEEALDTVDPAKGFLLDRDGEPLAAALTETDLPSTKEFVLAIGPEGGWSDRELALARDRGFVTVTLGGNILRTETAAVAALSVLVALLAARRS